MDGIWFLLSVISIHVVAWWCFRNDGARADGATKGLLAMTSPATKSDSRPR